MVTQSVYTFVLFQQNLLEFSFLTPTTTQLFAELWAVAIFTVRNIPYRIAQNVILHLKRISNRLLAKQLVLLYSEEYMRITSLEWNDVCYMLLYNNFEDFFNYSAVTFCYCSFNTFQDLRKLPECSLKEVPMWIQWIKRTVQHSFMQLWTVKSLHDQNV